MPFLKNRNNHFLILLNQFEKVSKYIFYTTNYVGARSLATLLNIFLLVYYRNYELDRQLAFLFYKTFNRRYYYLLLPAKNSIALVCRSRFIYKVLIKLRKRRNKFFNKIVF